MPPMYLEYTFATPALRRLVRSAWCMSYTSEANFLPGVIVPDAHVEFLFQTGVPCATLAAGAERARPSPAAMIYGLRHGALRMKPAGGNAVIGFRVAPAVASLILRMPLSGCWDEPVALSELIGPEAEDLLDRLAEVPVRSVAPVLESWLLSRLNGWDAEHAGNLRLQNALIWRVTGETVSSVADVLGVTDRTLRRHCEAYSGLSPKQLVMSGRILRACGLLLDHRDKPISDVADSLSFADQSAFTNAFRRYVGMTPARFRAEPIVYCERFRG